MAFTLNLWPVGFLLKMHQWSGAVGPKLELLGYVPGRPRCAEPQPCRLRRCHQRATGARPRGSAAGPAEERLGEEPGEGPGRAGSAMAERRRRARVQGGWAGGAAGRLAGKARRRLGPAGRAGGGGRAGCRGAERRSRSFGRPPFVRSLKKGSVSACEVKRCAFRAVERGFTWFVLPFAVAPKAPEAGSRSPAGGGQAWGGRDQLRSRKQFVFEKPSEVKAKRSLAERRAFWNFQ